MGNTKPYINQKPIPVDPEFKVQHPGAYNTHHDKRTTVKNGIDHLHFVSRFLAHDAISTSPNNVILTVVLAVQSTLKQRLKDDMSIQIDPDKFICSLLNFQ